jgi:hypothetical protein
MKTLKALLFAVIVLSSMSFAFAAFQGTAHEVRSIAVDDDNIYLSLYNVLVGSKVEVYSRQTNQGRPISFCLRWMLRMRRAT